MGLAYTNLDRSTRTFMLEELDADVRQGTLYMSPRLSQLGEAQYPSLLREATNQHDDDWLVAQLKARSLLKSHEQRRKPKGGFTMAAVPATASETLAEGEFNRFYARGLCARALAEGTSAVVVYRAKAVSQPRPESEAKINQRMDPKALLEDLRTSQGVEPSLGLPPGPNSGLSIRLP